MVGSVESHLPALVTRNCPFGDKTILVTGAEWPVSTVTDVWSVAITVGDVGLRTGVVVIDVVGGTIVVDAGKVEIFVGMAELLQAVNARNKMHIVLRRKRIFTSAYSSRMTPVPSISW